MTNSVPKEIVGELTPEEIAVVQFLVEDWKKRYRVTTIEQGLRASGLVTDLETRLKIGAYIKSMQASNPDFSQRVKRWGVDPLVLNNEEKLVAKCVDEHSRHGRHFPTIAEIGGSVGLEESRVEAALHTLYWIGFLDATETSESSPFKLSKNHNRFRKGLGFTFHTVILEDGEEFNVQCAADALILAATDYAERNVSIEDACYHCLDRLQIKTEKGKAVLQSPQGVRLYEGDD